jgi:hypothetical protein
MSKGIKQSDGTMCYAKNPATCRKHKQPQQTPKTPGEIFEAAMQRRLKGTSMEAQIMYTKHMYKTLQENYTPEPLTETISGYRDYSAASVEALQKYNEEYLQVSQNWSDEQKTAVRDYTGLTYKSVNEFLRDEKKWEAEVKPQYKAAQSKMISETIHHLDALFAEAKPTEPRTVYRTVGQSTTKAFTSSEDLAKAQGWVEGETIEFSSYLSTTTDAHLVPQRIHQDEDEHTDVVFVIQTNQGVPVDVTVLDKSKHSFTQDSEREILLPRGMKFQVDRVTRSVGFEPNPDGRNDRTIQPLTIFLTEK